MKIYKHGDLIPFKLGEVTVWLTPMKWEHKQKITGLIMMTGGEETSDALQTAFLTLKYSVAQVDGLVNADDTPWSVESDPSGGITDESVNELLQIAGAPSLVQVAVKLLNNIRDLSADGVLVDMSAVKVAKKKT